PISEKAATAAQAAKEWRDAAQALAQAVADGKTGAALTPFTTALAAAKTALDTAQKDVQDATKAAVDAITDEPLNLTDYQPTQPKSGLLALENVDLFNLLCLPPDTDGANGDIPSG